MAISPVRHEMWGQATVAHIARTEVLEVLVNAGGALVLSATITSACYDVIALEAQTAELLLEDPTDMGALFARAMNDVREAGGASDRWRGARRPRRIR